MFFIKDKSKVQEVNEEMFLKPKVESNNEIKPLSAEELLCLVKTAKEVMWGDLVFLLEHIGFNLEDYHKVFDRIRHLEQAFDRILNAEEGRLNEIRRSKLQPEELFIEDKDYKGLVEYYMLISTDVDLKLKAEKLEYWLKRFKEVNGSEKQ